MRTRKEYHAETLWLCEKEYPERLIPRWKPTLSQERFLTLHQCSLCHCEEGPLEPVTLILSLQGVEQIGHRGADHLLDVWTNHQVESRSQFFSSFFMVRHAGRTKLLFIWLWLTQRETEQQTFPIQRESFHSYIWCCISKNTPAFQPLCQMQGVRDKWQLMYWLFT